MVYITYTGNVAWQQKPTLVDTYRVGRLSLFVTCFFFPLVFATNGAMTRSLCATRKWHVIFQGENRSDCKRPTPFVVVTVYNRNRRKTYYRPNTSFSWKLTEHELSMDNVGDQTWLRERKRGGKYMLYVHVPMDALYCGRIGIVDQLVRVGQTNEKGRTSNSTSSSIHLAHPDTYTDTFDESIYVVDVQSCPLSLEASLHF